MSRPLRLEFSGALYHVTSRGDRREDIYEDDADRKAFLSVLAYEEHKGVRSHAVIGDQSSGLRSRPGNYSFTPVVLRSST